MSYRPWLSVSLLSLILTGCEIPGGASVPLPDDSSFQVQVPYEQVSFTVAVPAQGLGGLNATAMPLDLKPRLYYRYLTESRVNGNFIAMPNPPLAYIIRKVPYYKVETDDVQVRVNLHNGGNDVIRTSQAVCSFDINGKTVVSAPLGATDLLPGHDVSVMVQGPLLSAFENAPAEGSMTIWLYGLSADKSQTMRWDAAYSFKQEIRQVKGEVLGTTSSADDAKSYEGREEPAPPDAGGSGPR